MKTIKEIKTPEMKAKLEAIFRDKNNWNKLIDVDGEKYIYISAVNELRREVKQPSGTIAQMIACFEFISDRFMWCC